jgi:hypothetical protein
VELEIERAQFLQELVVQLHHLVGRHAVAGDLEREVVFVAELLRGAIPQIAQLHEAFLQRDA